MDGYTPVVPDTNRDLQMPLETDFLQRDGSAGLEPPVLLRRQPLVQAFLQSVELL